MSSKKTTKSAAWVFFDHIVAQAAPSGMHSNPWSLDSGGQVYFEPDYETLERLLGVPLYLKAGTQSGVPALALDVWLSYEFRRAGFELDRVWPRPTNPRILPAPVAALIKALPRSLQGQVSDRLIKRTSMPGVASSSASILGKNYLEQVDVIITDWATGPELLVSTKRMDSSYGKNAPNRVEESYGDAKNLRLRHPLAALGFVYGLRSDILEKEPTTADWLFDLLIKLGREDDAYHATCLVLIEYEDEAMSPDDELESPAGLSEPTQKQEGEVGGVDVSTPDATIDLIINNLPKVKILKDRTPEELMPSRFLAEMVFRVLDATPVSMHEEARRRLAEVRCR